MVQRLIKFISMEEFRKVLAKEKDKKYKLAYILAMGSGLRLSEIVGYKREDGTEIKPLTIEQVDLPGHQIRVMGKRKKERITVTSPWLNEKNLKMLPLNIKRRTLQRRFTNLCMKVLNKEFSIHCCRHGFANFMVNEKNVPLPMVQSMLGHTRLDTTGIYTRSNPVKAISAAWDSFC